MRRNLREGASQLVSLTPSGPTPPPLPASVADWWHSDFDCTPAVWTSQILAQDLIGMGTTPVVGPDAGWAAAGDVAQANIAGSATWVGTSLTTNLLAGTRPYWCAILRNRTLNTTGPARCTYCIRGGASATDFQMTHRTNINGGNVFEARRQNGATATIATAFGAQDTLPHFVELVLNDTAGQLELWHDGILLASNPAASGYGVSAADVTHIAFGALITGTGFTVQNYSDVSGKMLMNCTAVPTAPERAALLAYSQGYGTP